MRLIFVYLLCKQIDMSLQIILNKEGGQAEGVMIPLDDWQSLEPYVDKGSELYRLMTNLVQKPVFDMSPGEFASFVRPVAALAKQQSRDLGLPDIYKDERCKDDSHFIRRYPNGRKELVALDIHSRSFSVLEILEK